MESRTPATRRSNWNRQFEEDSAVIYAVDREFRLAQCNKSWDRFAIENGNPELSREKQIGCNVLDVIPALLRPFYKDAFEYVLESGHDWAHLYQCSSAREFRQFQMRILPQPEGWLVIHSLVCAQIHTEHEFRADLSRYSSDSSIVTMCAHCRRTKASQDGANWDWVPAFLESPPEHVSHGLCGVCFAYYYPAYQEAAASSE